MSLKAKLSTGSSLSGWVQREGEENGLEYLFGGRGDFNNAAENMSFPATLLDISGRPKENLLDGDFFFLGFYGRSFWNMAAQLFGKKA